MVVVPTASELATPSPPAAFAAPATCFGEAHTWVRFWTVPSVKVPVAVNACDVPRAISGFTGVTAIETSLAPETVSVVEPVTPECVAEIVALPRARLLARPYVPAVFETGAPAADELHSTWVVRSWMVPSEKVPVAVNCWLVPRAIVGFVGVTSTATRTALDTVSVVDPLTPERVAERSVSPRPTECARPWLPGSFETVDAAGAEESQVTCPVTSCVVPSVKIPVAANCRLVPSAICAFVGVISSETSAALETVSVVDPLMPE
jgi:hypothetical protein